MAYPTWDDNRLFNVARLINVWRGEDDDGLLEAVVPNRIGQFL